jgi:hypothetical protein
LREGFNHIYIHNTPYRLTGVVLSGLLPENRVQLTLFDDTAKIEKMTRIYHSVDELSARFGKHTVQHASSLPVKLQAQHAGSRGDTPKRMANLLRGENMRQRLGLPMLNVRV